MTTLPFEPDLSLYSQLCVMARAADNSAFKLEIKRTAPEKSTLPAEYSPEWTQIGRVSTPDAPMLERMFNLLYSVTFPSVEGEPRLKAGAPTEGLAVLVSLANAFQEAPAEVAQRVYEAACTQWEQGSTSAAANEALQLFDDALSLGSIESSYMAAKVCEELASKVGFKTREGKTLLSQAVRYYQKGAELGLARSHLQLATMYTDSGQFNLAVQEWQGYFGAFEGAQWPKTEMDYLCEVLHDQYFKAGIQPKELPFLKGQGALVPACRAKFPKDAAFQTWIQNCSWTWKDRALERAKLPALVLVGLALLYKSRPELAIALSLMGAYYWYRKKKKTLPKKSKE